MKARLVSYSTPTEEFQEHNIANVEELIAFCARVSNPSNQFNNETGAKLIHYLLKHKHFSPFEMVSACIEIETTRDIAHQILRHRSFSFQEFSQRYADPTKDMQFELSEARLQDTKNRQNSIEVNDYRLQAEWDAVQQKVIDTALAAYKWADEHGIAKEVKRKVLPEGLTGTRLYMQGTLRSWIHYIELRSANGTQKEHMEVARECAKAIAAIFPMMNEFVEGTSREDTLLDRLVTNAIKKIDDDDGLFLTTEEREVVQSFTEKATRFMGMHFMNRIADVMDGPVALIDNQPYEARTIKYTTNATLTGMTDPNYMTGIIQTAVEELTEATKEYQNLAPYVMIQAFKKEVEGFHEPVFEFRTRIGVK